MTEADWLDCPDPRIALHYLRGKVSDRKMRLFGCACCRGLFHPFQSRSHLQAVDASERVADGLGEIHLPAMHGLWEQLARSVLAGRERCEVRALRAVLSLSIPEVVSESLAALRETGRPGTEQLRCIFGNPFRTTTVAPSVLTWSNGTVQRLAHAIYTDRRFQDLPILADALEDAGCTDADILNHCREPGPHARGCWVVDLLLGKS